MLIISTNISLFTDHMRELIHSNNLIFNIQNSKELVSWGKIKKLTKGGKSEEENK